MTTSLATLSKGHEFPPASFALTSDWVGDYVAAVGDESIAAVGPAFAPPMAIAALSIRAMIEASPLPPGTLHAGQELAFHRAVRVGERLTAGARVANRGERAGWVLMSVDMHVSAGDESVMTGRATVTFPAEAT